MRLNEVEITTYSGAKVKRNAMPVPYHKREPDERRKRRKTMGWRIRFTRIEIIGLEPAVLRLHDSGYSERQIATFLGLNVSSVHRQIARWKEEKIPMDGRILNEDRR
jgi:hypothetical protein